MHDVTVGKKLWHEVVKWGAVLIILICKEKRKKKDNNQEEYTILFRFVFFQK